MEEEGLTREDAVNAVCVTIFLGWRLDNRCTQIAAFNLALACLEDVGRDRIASKAELACSGLGINAKEARLARTLW